MKNKTNANIKQVSHLDFSKHLFWDIDAKTLDFIKHKQYVINRVMQYGLYKDWKNILHFYGLDTITDTAKNIRDLDMKSMEFLSLLSNVPKDDFVCYTTTRSNQKHWNF